MKEIICAINLAVGTALEIPGENIHNESVPQGLVVPAVFVMLRDIDKNDMLYRKSQKRLTFEVIYLDDTSNHIELVDIADKLNRALTFITIENGAIKRGHDLTWHISEDNVLHCSVSYDITSDITENDEKVELLTQERNSKE